MCLQAAVCSINVLHLGQALYKGVVTLFITVVPQVFKISFFPKTSEQSRFPQNLEPFQGFKHIQQKSGCFDVFLH